MIDVKQLFFKLQKYNNNTKLQGLLELKIFKFLIKYIYATMYYHFFLLPLLPLIYITV